MNDELAQSRVFLDSEALENFGRILKTKSISKIAILCDRNTQEYCLPALLAALPDLPTDRLEILEIEPGEGQKDIEVLAQLWEAFGALNLDRKSLLINLGGGVITDLGGFAAACYMRGIDFVNFPTTLLAMTDASVGAKTGINFGGFKNRIGLFVEPLMVGIVPAFLKSLPEEEVLSGWAEMLKHGLIADSKHYQELIRRKPKYEYIDAQLIAHSVSIKASVVQKDQREGGLRKILNFGHTVGHVLESHFAGSTSALSHGYAVALGMQVELSLSVAFAQMDKQEAQLRIDELAKFYPFPTLDIEEEQFYMLLKGDKKNVGAKLNFSLLEKTGAAIFDQEVPAAEVWQHFKKLRDV